MKSKSDATSVLEIVKKRTKKRDTRIIMHINVSGSGTHNVSECSAMVDCTCVKRAIHVSALFIAYVESLVDVGCVRVRALKLNCESKVEIKRQEETLRVYNFT